MEIGVGKLMDSASGHLTYGGMIAATRFTRMHRGHEPSSVLLDLIVAGHG
jgi:hypothetical protein